MTDTVAIQDRIGQLCHQFKLPTMGARSVSRFTAAGHGEALPTFLEVLEEEAEDRRHRRIDRLRKEAKLPSGKTGRPSTTTGCPWCSGRNWSNWPRATLWNWASTCWPSDFRAPARMLDAGHPGLPGQ